MAAFDPTAVPQRRLGLALATYVGAIVVIVTLVPFQLVWPPVWRLVGYRGAADVVANVVMFVPLGFFVAFARRGRPLLAGLVLSAAVELVQQAIPGRAPSLLDVVTNGAGAGLGGILYRLIADALERRPGARTGVLALDLPLMGLVYLLVPLLWLTGFAAGGEPSRRWLAALIVLAGSLALAAVDRHGLRPRRIPGWAMPLSAGGWSLAGLAPGWLGRPGFLAVAVLGSIAATALFSVLLAGREPEGRRYELPAVRRVAVPFAVYLGLAALWPVDRLVPAWHGSLSLRGAIGDATQVAIFRLLELVAAATVAGYALAEAGGRRAAGGGAVAAGSSLAVGVGLALVRGFHPAYGASLMELGLLSVAALQGGVLYRLQRSYVRSLLGRGGGGPSPLPLVPYRIGPPAPTGEGFP